MRLRYFLVLCLVIAIAALLPYSSLTPSSPAPSPEFDFDISIPKADLFLGHHVDKTECVVNVTLTRGSPQPVNLTISGLPSSLLNYSFNPNSGLPPFTSTLIISLEVEILNGLYELTITGTGGGKSHSVSVSLECRLG